MCRSGSPPSLEEFLEASWRRLLQLERASEEADGQIQELLASSGPEPAFSAGPPSLRPPPEAPTVAIEHEGGSHDWPCPPAATSSSQRLAEALRGHLAEALGIPAAFQLLLGVRGSLLRTADELAGALLQHPSLETPDAEGGELPAVGAFDAFGATLPAPRAASGPLLVRRQRPAVEPPSPRFGREDPPPARRLPAPAEGLRSQTPSPPRGRPGSPSSAGGEVAAVVAVYDVRRLTADAQAWAAEGFRRSTADFEREVRRREQHRDKLSLHCRRGASRPWQEHAEVCGSLDQGPGWPLSAVVEFGSLAFEWELPDLEVLSEEEVDSLLRYDIAHRFGLPIERQSLFDGAGRHLVAAAQVVRAVLAGGPVLAHDVLEQPAPAAGLAGVRRRLFGSPPGPWDEPAEELPCATAEPATATPRPPPCFLHDVAEAGHAGRLAHTQAESSTADGVSSWPTAAGTGWASEPQVGGGPFGCSPPSPAAERHRRGLGLMSLGSIPEAIAQFSEALQLDPQHSPSLRDRGRAWGMVSRHQEALADLDASLALAPGDALARRARARLLGDHRQALDDVNAALVRHPAHDAAGAAALRMHRGEALMALGRHVEAEGDFSAALDGDPHGGPRSGTALALRGACRVVLGRCREALQDLDGALALQPDDAFARTSRGGAFFGLGLHAQALADLDAALALRPSDAYALGLRGAVKRVLGRYHEAKRDLNRALLAEPHCAFALSNRGATSMALGHFRTAQPDLEAALELNPDDRFSLSMAESVERILRDQGRPPEPWPGAASPPLAGVAMGPPPPLLGARAEPGPGPALAPAPASRAPAASPAEPAAPPLRTWPGGARLLAPSLAPQWDPRLAPPAAGPGPGPVLVVHQLAPPVAPPAAALAGWRH